MAIQFKTLKKSNERLRDMSLLKQFLSQLWLSLVEFRSSLYAFNLWETGLHEQVSLAQINLFFFFVILAQLMKFPFHGSSLQG